jgi:glycine/D-amino acid oxidase-like deaminating enzyme
MYEALAREMSLRERHLGEPFTMLSRAEQATEIATDHYFGAARIDDHAGLHPGLYHQGLLDAARVAGVSIAAWTPVTQVARNGGRFAVSTPRATLSARDLIVATNGYSGNAFPWLKRRVIPFEAYQTVSEPLDPARIRWLLPGDRTCIDWNFNVDWMRRAPDDPGRLIFGGLTGRRNQNLHRMAKRLHRRLLRIFPDLADLRFDHVWTGKCAGTFDLYPHIGQHEGYHYAIGYCFAGVPMGTLFGRKLALRILGRKGGDSVFDRPLPSNPLYWGNPWFVPYAIAWMSRHDG